MEAVRDFISFPDAGPVGAGPAGAQSAETDLRGAGMLDAASLCEASVRGGRPPALVPGVEAALSLLRQASPTAVQNAALLGCEAAADLAAAAEELSRLTDYWQLVAAAAVDRTRKRAVASTAGTPGWTTGWRESSMTTGSAAEETTVGQSAATQSAAGQPVAPSRVAVVDGFRNTAEFLRARLHIPLAEARIRLRLAEGLLPRQELTGELLPPAREELGTAVADGKVSARSAAVAVAALGRAKPMCDSDALDRMEHELTRTAVEHDPDFLVRIAQRWLNALDQDGTEPSEELLRQLQGAFIRKPRHGLQHIEIFATEEQFEQLLTVMNSATNPRVCSTGGASGTAPATVGGHPTAAGPAAAGGGLTEGVAAETAPGGIGLDLRSVPQLRLDGLVGGCKVALGSGGLPAAGGLRPQVMVTIDYRDLLERLERTVGTHPAASAGPAEPGNKEQTGVGMDSTSVRGRFGGTGTMLFTGPVTASTVRKIACDADIIPVLLGSEGRVLDIGRASRVFPPHIRKALVARDQGCAFPGCSMPAPWCEAHHIDYWSRGGSTGADNGALLCSHHHHVIHKEQWEIRVRTGVPWFIPPPYLDPGRRPRRNDFFRPVAA